MSEESAVLRIGQKGTAFTATVDQPDSNNIGSFIIVDLTQAILVQIEFQRPDKTTFVNTASVTNTPTDGKVQFNDTDGVLDQVGANWQIRATATFSDGYYPGSWTIFEVGT